MCSLGIGGETAQLESMYTNFQVIVLLCRSWGTPLREQALAWQTPVKDGRNYWPLLFVDIQLLCQQETSDMHVHAGGGVHVQHIEIPCVQCKMAMRNLVLFVPSVSHGFWYISNMCAFCVMCVLVKSMWIAPVNILFSVISRSFKIRGKTWRSLPDFS